MPEETDRYWDILLADQGYHDINPLVCGRERCRSMHSFGPAVRMYWLLHYVEKGKGKISAGGKDYPVESGQIFVIRPTETTFYQADCDDPWSYYWVGFSSGIAMPPDMCTQRVITCRDAGRIFRQMMDADKKKQGKEMHIASCIYELLSMMYQGEGNTSDYVAQAKTYIESNYMKEVSICSLAEQLNINRSSLSAAFRERMGKSPQQFLVSYRMEQACILIGTYNYSPGETAVMVGYPDVFSFSRMFKRIYGISPSEYKKGKQAR